MEPQPGLRWPHQQAPWISPSYVSIAGRRRDSLWPLVEFARMSVRVDGHVAQELLKYIGRDRLVSQQGTKLEGLIAPTAKSDELRSRAKNSLTQRPTCIGSCDSDVADEMLRPIKAFRLA